MPEPLNALSKKLGYVFQNPALFQQALTHRSASTKHNERLEFLGDAVLDLVIADALLKRYPTHKEGELSPLRATLVKGEMLATIANTLNIGKYLKLGTGEIKTGGAKRTSILANALEAIFGAVFLDGGFDAAKQLILKIYEPHLDTHHPDEILTKDAKTALQEYLHAHKLPLPTYTLTQTTGAQHAQMFHITCSVSELNLSQTASSTTRKKAEQLAAEKLLKHLK